MGRIFHSYGGREAACNASCEIFVSHLRERNATGVGGTIENFAVSGEAHHAGKAEGATGDIFRQALHASVIPGFNAHGVINAEPGVPPTAHICGSCGQLIDGFASSNYMK